MPLFVFFILYLMLDDPAIAFVLAWLWWILFEDR